MATSVEVTMVLADSVQVAEGKISMLGGGWDRIPANQPRPQALAILVHVPWDMTNTTIHLSLRCLNHDGEEVMNPDGEPMGTDGKLEVGRPVGMKRGERLNIPIEFRANGRQYEPGGYVWVCKVDDDVVARWPFRAYEEGE